MSRPNTSGERGRRVAYSETKLSEISTAKPEQRSRCAAKPRTRPRRARAARTTLRPEISLHADERGVTQA